MRHSVRKLGTAIADHISDATSPSGLQLVVRIYGVVVSTQGSTLTVTIGADVNPTPGVPYVSSYVPCAGDNVMLDQIGRTYVVVGGEYTNNAVQSQAGYATIVFSSANTATVTVTFNQAFSVVPLVQITPQESHNFDLVCTVQSVSTTGFTARLAQRSGANISGTVQLNWSAQVASS